MNMTERWPRAIGSVLLFLAVAASAASVPRPSSALPGVGSTGDELPEGRQQYPHRIEFTARTGERFRFDYEIVVDPDTGPLYRVIHVEVDEDGRQYYLDDADGVIKVFGPDNGFLFQFGGRGEAPGKWVRTAKFNIAPDGRIYVWDDAVNAFHVFDPHGAYSHRLRMAAGSGRLPGAFVVWLSDTDLVLGGTSLAPEYTGYFVHHFRIGEDENGDPVLNRVGSFLELPEVTPGLYRQLLAGWLAADQDGTLLYAAARRHHIAKLSADGTVIWQISDPEILPDAAEHLEATPSGRVRITQRAASYGIVGARDWIIHQVFLGVEGAPKIPEGVVVDGSQLDMSNATISKIWEVIKRGDSDPAASRIVIDTEEDVWFRAADKEGRLYGVVRFFDPIPVRGHFYMIPQQGVNHE